MAVEVEAVLSAYLRTADGSLAVDLVEEVVQHEAQLILEGQVKGALSGENLPLQSLSRLRDLKLCHAISKMAYELHPEPYPCHSPLHTR